MKTVIRRAEAKDAEEVAEMWHKLGSMMEGYSDLNLLKDDAKETAVNGFEERIRDGEFTVYLAEREGEVLGYINLKEESHPTRQLENKLKITDLYIKENHRGKGLGTELVEKAVEYARKNDCEYIQVSAETKNKKALEFYLDKNFKEKQVTLSRKL